MKLTSFCECDILSETDTRARNIFRLKRDTETETGMVIPSAQRADIAARKVTGRPAGAINDCGEL